MYLDVSLTLTLNLSILITWTLVDTGTCDDDDAAGECLDNTYHCESAESRGQEMCVVMHPPAAANLLEHRQLQRCR